MKKLITILGLTGLFALSSYAAPFTLSIQVNGGTYTNLLPYPANPTYITQIQLYAPQSNSTVVIYDVPTNIYSMWIAPTTNVTFYATNYTPAAYTNYYGLITQPTNYLALMRVTNALNNTNFTFGGLKFAGSALGGLTSTYTGDYQFNYGLWATNTTVWPVQVIITGTY